MDKVRQGVDLTVVGLGLECHGIEVSSVLLGEPAAERLQVAVGSELRDPRLIRLEHVDVTGPGERLGEECLVHGVVGDFDVLHLDPGRGSELGSGILVELRVRTTCLATDEIHRLVGLEPEGAAARELSILSKAGLRWAVALRHGSRALGLLFFGGREDHPGLPESDVQVLRALQEAAVVALREAAALSGDSELDARLAQAHLNLGAWEDAAAAAETSLKKGVDDADEVQLILGMALYELERYPDAIDAFRVAQKTAKSAAMAGQWIRAIESEQNRLNEEFLDRINAPRRVYLTPTTLDGLFTLRICVLSFRTHMDRMEMALEDIREAASAV